MSIGLRIKELRSDLGLSQIDFANKIGVKQSPLSQMEGGKILPSIETLSSIIREFNISYSWLIDGIGTKQNVKDTLYNESISNSIRKSEETKNDKNLILIKNQIPAVVTVDPVGEDNVVLVNERAAAGYLSGYGDPEFVERLPAFRLPNTSNGTFRMFQVSGHSMYPTIQDGSYVVGEWVQDWYNDIKDNRVYVVVSHEGILVKRVLNRLDKYQNLFLKSDNRKEYPSFPVTIDKIKEVWAVKMHLGFDLADPAVLYDRVNDLEAEMEEIKRLLRGGN